MADSAIALGVPAFQQRQGENLAPVLGRRPILDESLAGEVEVLSSSTI